MIRTYEALTLYDISTKHKQQQYVRCGTYMVTPYSYEYQYECFVYDIRNDMPRRICPMQVQKWRTGYWIHEDMVCIMIQTEYDVLYI